MTTIRDIVTGAYRLIGIVAADEAMTADQAEAGLVAFNEMTSAWLLDNIPAIAADVTLDANFPLHGAFREGTRHLLAARLAHQYQAPVNFDPSVFIDKVRAYYLTIDPVTVDPALTWRGSTRRGFGGA